jgi:threonine dehydrogenase-like Zn-dependent dehydrogenase
VAVFGCGPVGLFAIMSARLLGADRILAVDRYPDRLELARALGAEAIDFSGENPVKVIKELTGGIGVDRAIDAVGVDAMGQDTGDNRARAASPQARTEGERFVAGDHPTQALDWAVEAVAKAGTIGIVGVYPQTAKTFPIGQAMNKNLTIKMGNCNHRRYVPHLVDLVRGGSVDPLLVLTQHQPLTDAIEAYKTFDHRGRGWTKVKLEPAAA